MSKCPYTWVRGVLGGKRPAAIANSDSPARNLMVLVVRDGEERVRVALPSRSARWLIELIPSDVVSRIKAEDIPLEAIAAELNQQDELFPRAIFSLHEENRLVEVWLE